MRWLLYQLDLQRAGLQTRINVLQGQLATERDRRVRLVLRNMELRMQLSELAKDNARADS